MLRLLFAWLTVYLLLMASCSPQRFVSWIRIITLCVTHWGVGFTRMPCSSYCATLFCTEKNLVSLVVVKVITMSGRQYNPRQNGMLTDKTSVAVKGCFRGKIVCGCESVKTWPIIYLSVRTKLRLYSCLISVDIWSRQFEASSHKVKN